MILDTISINLTILNEKLETKINQALKNRILSRIKKGCFKIAIDKNLIPDYGNLKYAR